MARDFNKVILLGRLARDPDVRFTPNKQKVARISLAVGRQWRNKVTGEMQSHTDFISVTAWSFTADILERYCRKGSQILIEGRISTRDYDDVKTGIHKWVTEVIADSITLLGSPRTDGGQQGGYAQPGAYGQSGGYGQQGGYGQNGYQQKPNAAQMPDFGSLRGEDGFDDSPFPLDFAEVDGQQGDGTTAADVDIPF